MQPCHSTHSRGGLLGTRSGQSPAMALWVYLVIGFSHRSGRTCARRRKKPSAVADGQEEWPAVRAVSTHAPQLPIGATISGHGMRPKTSHRIEHGTEHVASSAWHQAWHRVWHRVGHRVFGIKHGFRAWHQAYGINCIDHVMLEHAMSTGACHSHAYSRARVCACACARISQISENQVPEGSGGRSTSAFGCPT